MAKLIGTGLTDDLYERLRGDRLDAYADKVILLVTLDDSGWPHPAMLSYFEVVACGRRDIRLATYANSRTTENMRLRGRATLIVIDERLAYYIKGSVTELRRTMVAAPHNASLQLRVEQVLADEANEEHEAGAYVAGGVTYHNPNRAAELAQARVIIKELATESRAGSA